MVSGDLVRLKQLFCTCAVDIDCFTYMHTAALDAAKLLEDGVKPREELAAQNLLCG